MSVSLEYVVGQYSPGNKSYAIKSHRTKNQNPGLEVLIERGIVTWTLLGIAPGRVEIADPTNPAATHLDFYIGRNQLMRQMALFPRPTTRGVGSRLAVTIPVGTERPGGKKIAWRGPIAKIPIDRSTMIFPDGKLRLTSSAPCVLNIDRQTANYPLDDGSRHEVHFGVECTWEEVADKRIKVARASLVMSSVQYSEVLKAIASAF